MVVINAIQLEDLPAIIDLHLQGLTHELALMNEIIPGKSVDPSGAEQLRNILGRVLQTGEGHICVARLENEIIGYCLITKKIYPVEIPKLCGCINGIYIKPEHRKNGLGRKLFEHTMKWLHNDNVTYIELYHMNNDPVATAFWKKMGFTPVQTNCVKILSST